MEVTISDFVRSLVGNTSLHFSVSFQRVTDTLDLYVPLFLVLVHYPIMLYLIFIVYTGLI